MNTKICAWVSRHAPTPGQQWDLRDYRIVILGAASTCFKNHRDVWGSIVCAVGNRPDLVVAVLPPKLLISLAEYADPTPVIRAPGEYDGDADQFNWSGIWQRVTGWKVETEVWSP